MKRILILMLIIFSAFSVFSQQNMPVNNLKITGKMYSNKSGGTDIIMQPSTDSLGQYELKNIADPEELLDGVNYRTLLNLAGYDSIRYELDGFLKAYSGGIVRDSTRIDESNLQMNRIGTGFTHLGDLAEHFGHVAPPYISIGADITDNGDSTITISESESYLKVSNDVDAEYVNIIVPEATLYVTPNSNEIVYLDYGGGTPTYKIRTSTGGYFYNNWDEIPVAPVINIGAKIIVNPFKLASTNGVYKNILGQLNYEAIRYLGGLLTSETGTRQLIVSAGAVLKGNDYEGNAGLNTSTGGTFTRMYYVTGVGWTRVTGQTTISNSQYNNISTGLATLTASPERWANKWLYHIEDNPDFWVIVEGQTAYTSLQDALDASFPAILPPEVSPFYAGALAVAQITVSGNETNIVEIQSLVGGIVKTGATATLHDNLGGISIAGNSVTYGHINNLDQDIYGGKTFVDSLFARTMPFGDSTLNVATTEFVERQRGTALDSVFNAINAKQDTSNAVIRDISFTTDNAVIVVDGSNRNVKETSYTLDASNYFTGENTGDQQLTTTGSAGQIAINGVNGNSITLNVDDADASATNEFQNLAYTPSPTYGTVGISNGTNATIPLATSTNAGLMPPGVTAWNQSVQTLTSTVDTLDVDDGLHGTLSISGNSDIRFENLIAGMSGNITVNCSATNDSLSFSNATVIFSPSIGSVSGKIPVSVGAGKKDCYSYWYDGTQVIINGTKDYE